MSDRLRFQGKCLLSEDGYLYMDIFDDLPPWIRERLRTSPFNLCAACVVDAKRSLGTGYEEAIARIEEIIRNKK